MSQQIHLLMGDERGLLSVRSADSGRTWSEPATLIRDADVHAIQRSPDDGTIYVGTRGRGLFRSLDEGQHWEQVPTPKAAERIRSLRIADDRLLVGTEAGSGLDAVPVGVLEWQDDAWRPLGDVRMCSGASTWSYPGPHEEVHVRHLALDPYRPGRIYAAMQVGGVCVSPDNGQSWSDRRNLSLDVHMAEPHPTTPGLLFAGAGGDGPGMFRSRDFGDTWEGVAEDCGTYVVQFAFDPGDPDRIYLGASRRHAPEWATAGGEGEMFRSDDGGDHWTKLSGGLPDLMESRVNVVWVDPTESSRVFFGGGLPTLARNPGIAHDAGVYFSPDRGESWTKVLGLERGEPQALYTVA